ncbi:MAG TPA: polysaccharide biosynthesis tyrosine autokinase [Gemmatimonadaceae bacterium]|nr:polysaccharide biosynthesis tyrosine autokinase [Gemmatimonadaceae bacterium]
MTEAMREGGAPPAGEPGDGGLTVRDLLATARRRWWVVLAVAALVTAIGTWRTFRQPRIYRSTATVKFQPAVAPIAGVQTPTGRPDFRVDPLLSEQELIRSSSVASRVVGKLGLQVQLELPSGVQRSAVLDGPPIVEGARPGQYALRFGDAAYELRSGGRVIARASYGDTLYAPGLRLVVGNRPRLSAREVALAVAAGDAVAAGVRSTLSTRARPQTDIIEIAYESTDPELAAAVANAAAQAYAEFSSESQRTAARGKTEFIRGSLAEQEARLAERQDALRAFKVREGITDVKVEQGRLAAAIDHFESERQQVIADRAVYETLLGKITAADTADEELQRLVGTRAVTDNKLVSDLYTVWFELLSTRDEAITTRGLLPRHPDVQAIDVRIRRTKSQLREASGLYLANLNSRHQTLATAIGNLRRQSERYPPLEAEQAKLEADVRTAQRLYDDLQSQLQLSRISESAEGGSVRLIDAAEVPSFAVLPLRRRAMMLAAILGLALGLGLAVLLDRLDTSVRSPDELVQRLDLNVLGMVPMIRLNGRRPGGAVGERLVTHFDPRSPVAEAYRSLRTNLAFARAASRLHTIVLTSPGPSDGKSTTAANLAITFAQQGQRTLVVDADLRRAVLDKSFGVPRSPGLTEVLVGDVALPDAVSKTEVDNLFVLPSGRMPPNPAELLGSAEMQRVLGEAKDRFDVVLFDSPPLLAVTDAAILSTMVDGTLLVVRMGETAREAVRRAVGQLRAVRGRLLGAVLNDVDFRKGSAYGQYGYYYYAYYGTDGQGNGNGVGGAAAAGRRAIDRLRKLARR